MRSLSSTLLYLLMLSRGNTALESQEAPCLCIRRLGREGAHYDEPEGPVAPPRQRLAVHGGIVLLHARDVPLVPQARAEPERQRWAARATLQPASTPS